jgi:hypothetical protein
MSIGTTLAAEWRTSTDLQTNKPFRQLTAARANSYPLYYFIPSITDQNDFLIFHSERSGFVNLFKLDLRTGIITQITDGHTRDSGWGIWCEYHLRGIFNHLSALNLVKREVYYFQDDEIRATHVDSLQNRIVHRIPNRISMGQTSFSPDGKRFAFIHADHQQFRQAMADREALSNMGHPVDHQRWRNALPVTIGLLDTDTGDYRDIIALDYHVHHVIFIDNRRVLVNHPRNEMGMWMINIDGTGYRHLRPKDAHGELCHQIITRNGIFYESYCGPNNTQTWFGRYDLETHTHEEVFLPNVTYAHTGNDPAGKFTFCDSRTETQDIYTIHHPRDAKRFELRHLRRLNKMLQEGQRFHCHPFLGPERKWMYFTEAHDGFSQVCALDVEDLVKRDEYW